MELNGIRFCYTLLTINHLAKANVANKEFLTHSAWLGRGLPNKPYRESTLYIYHFKSFPFLLRSSHKTNFQFKPYYQFLFSFCLDFYPFRFCLVFQFPFRVLVLSGLRVPPFGKCADDISKKSYARSHSMFQKSFPQLCITIMMRWCSWWGFPWNLVRDSYFCLSIPGGFFPGTCMCIRIYT